MEQPANIDLHGDRGVIFDEVIAFFDFDLTGASARMQVRTAPDASGTPLVSLTLAATPAQGVSIAYAGTDTLANHISAGRITRDDLPAQYASLADTDSLTLTLLEIRILATAMAFTSVPADEAGDDITLAYDILVTPSGGDEDKYAYGAFVVRGTVTQ